MGIRLGIGPYGKDQSNGPSTHAARLIFLRLAGGFTDGKDSQRVFNNKVPTSLLIDVFPSFTTLISDRFRLSDLSGPSSNFNAFYRGLASNISPGEVNEFIPNHEAIKRESPELHKKLLNWAKKWNLDKTEWFLDFAVMALRLWLFDHGEREAQSWERVLPVTREKLNDFIWDSEPDIKLNFSFRYKTISFSDGYWNYEIEDSKVWAGVVRNRFSDYLQSTIGPGIRELKGTSEKLLNESIDKHVRAVEAKIKKKGYRPTPRKYDYTHFAWVIRYQIEAWTYSQVARYYNAERQTVEEAVKRTAALLGLTLHPSAPGGRPLAREQSGPEGSSPHPN